MNNEAIAVIDSGIGGLTVLSKIYELLPNENYIYVMDKKYAPYGNKTDEMIAFRVDKICDNLIERNVKAIVVACNTATSVAIDELRKRLTVPIVGILPAIKPAFDAVKEGNILVMATSKTLMSNKFISLSKRYDSSRISLSPQPDLAMYIEENINKIEKLREKVFCILQEYDGVKAVVLGCTHYVHIKRLIDIYYNGKVPIFTGVEGVAKRLNFLLESNSLKTNRIDNCGKIVIEIAN